MDGEVEAQMSLHYSEAEPSDDPRTWWNALCEVIRRLHTRAPSPPLGICLCGRGTGLAFLDARWEPVDVPWPLVLAHARAHPGPSAAPGRAMGWGALHLAVRKVAPQAADRIVRVCGVKDYLNLRLTGEWATDASSAGCRAWPDDVAALGLRPEMLPPIRPADEVLGTVSARAGLPLSPGLPVFVGSHDGVCANIGTGMLAVGDGCVTLGTHGVLRVNTPAPLLSTPSFATFTYPYLGKTWTSGGDVLDGGAAVAWMVRLLGALDTDPRTFREGLAHLDALAAAAPAGANDLVFVPYLRGTISPRRAVDRRGAFLNVAAGHGPSEFARSTFEGTAFALRHIRDAFVAQGGVIHRLSLAGGGAHSRVWPAIIASALDTSFGLVDPDASSRGAAMLAATGLRFYPSVEAASAAMVRCIASVLPDPTWVMAYEQAYCRYRAAVDS